MIKDPSATKATRARRVPTSAGLKDIPPSKILKKNMEIKQEPPAVDLSMFTAPPKDFNFFDDMNDIAGFDLRNVTVEGYPGCCGAGIGHGIYSAMNGNADQRKKVVKEIDRRFRAHQRGIGMLILNHEQVNYFYKELEAEGFTCVSACTNPVHSNSTRVYLYIKTYGKPVEIPKSKSVAA